MDYKDRRLPLTLIGLAALLVGIVAAFFGPVEMYQELFRAPLWG